MEPQDDESRRELGRKGRQAQELFIELASHVRDALPANMQLSQLIGHGWYQRVARAAKASLVLVDAGLGHDASPLRRSILEHSVALVWMANSGQAAVDAVQRSHQSDVRHLVSMLGDGHEVPEGSLAMLGLELPSSPEEYLLTHKHRVERHGLTNLELPYKLESAITHPSLRSASYFWERTGDDSARPTTEPPSGNDDLPTLAGNAGFMLFAASAMDYLLDGVLHEKVAAAAALMDAEPTLPRPI